jgi:hypothetical protein
MANNRPWHFHPMRGVKDGFYVYRGSWCPGRGNGHPKNAGAVYHMGPRSWRAVLFGGVAKVETLRGKGRTRNEAVCDALCKKGIPYADDQRY